MASIFSAGYCHGSMLQITFQLELCRVGALDGARIVPRRSRACQACAADVSQAFLYRVSLRVDGAAGCGAWPWEGALVHFVLLDKALARSAVRRSRR